MRRASTVCAPIGSCGIQLSMELHVAFTFDSLRANMARARTHETSLMQSAHLCFDNTRMGQQHQPTTEICKTGQRTEQTLTTLDHVLNA